MTVLTDAMGQLFYSISVAMGIMITYGSYVKKETNLIKSVNQIEIFDSAVAFLAGLMIVPAVYTFSGTEGMASGPSLMFVSLPKVFGEMGITGHIVGVVFFVTVAFAALTSSVSILEIFTPNVMELSKGKVSRKKASIIGSIICMVLGIPVSFSFGMWGDVRILGMDIFSLYDNLICIVIYPLIALVTAIMVGWIWGKDKAINAISNGGELNRGVNKLWFFDVKFICPILLAVVVYTGIAGFLGI